MKRLQLSKLFDGLKFNRWIPTRSLVQLLTLLLGLCALTSSAQPNVVPDLTGLGTPFYSPLLTSQNKVQTILSRNRYPNLGTVQLKSIWINVSSVSSTDDFRIQLGTTTQTEYNSGPPFLFLDVPFQAFYSQFYTPNRQSNGDVEIVLDNPFTWNANQNLVVQVSSSRPVLFAFQVASSSQNLSLRAGSELSTSGNRFTNLPIIRFTAVPDKPALTLSGPTTFCSSGSVTISGPTLPALATGYLWSNGATTRDITVSSTGSYSLRLTSPCCTSDASDPLNVTVNPRPVRPLVFGQDQTFTVTANANTPAALYTDAGVPVLWSNGVVAETLTVTTPGTYTAQLVAAGCTSEVSNVINVEVPPRTVVWNGTGDFDVDIQNWNSGNTPDFQFSDSLIVNSGRLRLNVSQYLQVKHLVVNSGATLELGSYNFMIKNSILNNGTISGTNAGIILNVGITEIRGSGIIKTPSVSIGEDLNTLVLENKIRTGAFFCQVPVNVMHPNAELTIVADESKFLEGSWSTASPFGPVLFGTNNEQKFKVERHWDPALFNINGAWLNIGPPFRNYLVDKLSDGNPFAASTYDNSVPTNSSLFAYDPTNNQWPSNNGFVKFTSPNNKLSTGQGVRLWVTRSKANEGFMTFNGNPYALPLTIPLKYCPGGCTYTGAGANGYNLVGNPLVGGLNWSAVTKTGVNDAYWVWRNNIGQYASYAGGVGVNGADGIIGTGQAFWVEAETNSSSLAIDGFANSQGSRFMRTRPAENLVRLQILNRGRMEDEVAVRLDNNATSGLDNGLDARKFMQQNGGIATVQPDGARMAINSIPMLAGVVPVTIANSLVGQQIKIKLQNYTSTLPVWLAHASMGAPIQITDSATFTVPASWVTGLQLVFGSSLTDLSNKTTTIASVFPNPTTDRIEVQLTDGELTSLSIQDATGRVISTNPVQGYTSAVSLGSLPTGVYQLVISTTKGIIRKKVTKQ